MNDTRNIAIVDDHTMFRKGLSVLVNLFRNYTVSLDAANGRDFIRQLNPARLPDLLLLDIAMPEMDGYALTAWVNTHYPAIKILALSTMDSELAIIRMIRAGARGYLLKDAEPDELRQAFDEVLRYGYYYSQAAASKRFTREEGPPAHDILRNTDHLSADEHTFLRLTALELTDNQVALRMSISEMTVEAYRNNLFRKLQVSDKIGLLLFAIRHGIVQI